MLVCGDFNDTPYSYSYKMFSRRLKDSFVSKGNGFGATMNKAGYPLARIDYQFFDSRRVMCNGFDVIDSLTYSDHFAVEGFYSLK